MSGRTAALTVLALLAAACGGAGVDIENARVGQPTGPNAALYFTASSGGEADRLLGADTGTASDVELHTTVIDDDGTMSMRPSDAFELPAGGTLVLEPGGLHLMLVDAQRMEVGDVIEVVLTWENRGDMTIEAEVVPPGDTMSNDS